MKFYNLKDIKGFFQMIEKTKGDVYLLSEQGDKINLKSNLSRYVAFVQLFADKNIKEFELQVTESSDKRLLLKYLMLI